VKRSVALKDAIALSLLVGLAAFEPAKAEDCPGVATTTTPLPYSVPALEAIFQSEIGNIPGRKSADLVLVGDSLVQQWDVKLFRPRAAFNFGVGGDRTQNVLWRLEMPQLMALRPKDVVVLLGTNNLTAGDEPCAIVAGLQKVLAAAASVWPRARLWFIDIPPRGDGFAFRDAARKQTNAGLQGLKPLRTIDVDDAISCNGKQPCGNYIADNLHFSPAGYGVLTRLVTSAIR